MSKIHQAMRRAEKEGLATGIIPSVPQERPEGKVLRESPLRPPIYDLVLPKNEVIPNSVSDCSVTAERKKTTPDSRLVALSSRTYDGLRDRLRPAREEARAGGNDLKAILVTGVGSGDGKSLTAANLSISISIGLGERVLL